jgi:hypothetical protein
MVSHLRTYAPHAVLLAVIGLQCAIAGLWHQSNDALRHTLESGAPRQRVYALFVLTNRDTPRELDRESVRRLVKSEDPLVREWTMTANFTRLSPPLAQEAHIMSLRGSPEAVRCQFFLNYRPVVGAPLALGDLRRFLDASQDGS